MEMLLKDITSRLKYYKTLGDNSFLQIKDADFFYQPNEESNSIAIIIQHLYGNMMSRFTNFLTEDGEKGWRKRDAEFEPMEMTKQDLLDCWNTGWALVVNTLDSLTPADMTKQITIRGEKMFVYDALLRQLAHYPYHVGQIVYLARMQAGNNWKSLSIPKGGSEAFNAQETKDGAKR